MNAHLVLHAIRPARPHVTFGLLGDPSIARAGGQGWTTIDRPHRGAAVQWVDYGLLQISMSLMLDGISEQHLGDGHSVESDIAEVSSWEKPSDGRAEPPVLRMKGPVAHTSKEWVLKSLTWGAAIRHRSGHRVQQALDVVLLEYVPPALVVTGSPAKNAQDRQSSAGSGSSRRYTVRAGDTLQSIAAKKLGAAKRWQEIAKLNKLRDPNSLTVGQVLKLPPD